jgi:hypothetical protein
MFSCSWIWYWVWHMLSRLFHFKTCCFSFNGGPSPSMWLLIILYNWALSWPRKALSLSIHALGFEAEVETFAFLVPSVSDNEIQCCFCSRAWGWWVFYFHGFLRFPCGNITWDQCQIILCSKILHHSETRRPLPGLDLALEFKSSELGFGKCNPSLWPRGSPFFLNFLLRYWVSLPSFLLSFEFVDGLVFMVRRFQSLNVFK